MALVDAMSGAPPKCDTPPSRLRRSQHNAATDPLRSDQANGGPSSTAILFIASRIETANIGRSLTPPISQDYTFEMKHHTTVYTKIHHRHAARTSHTQQALLCKGLYL